MEKNSKKRTLVALVACAALCVALLCLSVAGIRLFAANTMANAMELEPLEGAELTPEDMDRVGQYLEPGLLAEVNSRIGSAAPAEYLMEYYEVAEEAGLGAETEGVFESVLGLTVR